MDSNNNDYKYVLLKEQVNSSRQILRSILNWYHVIAILCVISGLTTLLLPSLAIGQVIVGVFIIAYHLSIQRKLKKKIEEQENDEIQS